MTPSAPRPSARQRPRRSRRRCAPSSSWRSTSSCSPGRRRSSSTRRSSARCRAAARRCSDGGIDWGHAEALAFASLLTEGVGVRITGQDAERGTFSHRQAVLHDVNTGETYTPLANLPQARGAVRDLQQPALRDGGDGLRVRVQHRRAATSWCCGKRSSATSPTSRSRSSTSSSRPTARSGGRTRVSCCCCRTATRGRAPSTRARVSSGSCSSCAEGNMIVAYPSTPAQYFHILRRQALRRTTPAARADAAEVAAAPAGGGVEARGSGDGHVPAGDRRSVGVQRTRDQVQRLVFCTGKIYYDLDRDASARRTIAIVRVEELCPWPRETVGEIVDRYPNVEEVVWAQEEPKNMGAWTYVQPRLRASIGTLPTLRYIGRPERASPAEGYKATHDEEQARIVDEVLDVRAGVEEEGGRRDGNGCVRERSASRRRATASPSTRAFDLVVCERAAAPSRRDSPQRQRARRRCAGRAGRRARHDGARADDRRASRRRRHAAHRLAARRRGTSRRRISR